MDRFNLLEDAAVYAPPVALTLVVQHLLMARPDHLPRSAPALLARYAAGSAAVAVSLTCYALRRPQASARDVATMLWLLLLVAGAATAVSHAAADAVLAVRAAERRRCYEESRDADAVPAPFRR
jgi:hypothetical protein